MSLNKEWNRRIGLWLDELKRHFYLPMGTVDLEGFTTFDRLTLSQAEQGVFRPMPVGTKWGAKWEYGWFRGALTLPPEVRGHRVVLRLNAGLEGLVFLNGRAAGARDREHQEITLSRSAQGGESFHILAEFYGGHGPIEESVGPVPPGRDPLPEPGTTQRTVEPSTWGYWDDEAFGLWIDAETLLQTRNVLPESTLRVAEIDAGLQDFTRLADFELDPQAMRQTFITARKRLRPLLDCVNGTTAPTMFIFGNSHLDLAWQWPFEETVHKSARTMSTQLAYMEEYPEFRFYWCQVPLFEILRDQYPEIWERTKARITDGTIMVDGGMWIEPDTNLPGGESLIRQIVLAREFYQGELGHDTKLLWLPDTFGFSAALPQIMKGAGLDYFGTKKILDQYNDGDPFPLTTFRWQGLDGTEVLAHAFRKSNSPIDPKTLAKRWDLDRLQRDHISTYLFPFGHGDGGGGVTRTHLEFTRRLADLEGLPRTRWAHPLDFYRDREARGPVEEVYVGELYFPEHRGTYTSQANIKKGSRKAELALRDAELWSAWAGVFAGLAWPQTELRHAWRTLLFNHFHDVIAGASIRRVNEEAETQLAQVRVQAGELTQRAVELLGPPADQPGWTVFNSLSWERTVLVLLPESKPLPAAVSEYQTDERGTWVEVRLPSLGWAPILGEPRDPASPGSVAVRHHQDSFILENQYLTAVLDSKGRITSLVDKTTNLEIAAGPCNDFHLFRDVTNDYDAWDINSMYRSVPVDIDGGESSVRIAVQGPLFVSLELRRRISSSTITQEIRLARHSRRIEFHSVIDWHENHKLLKVEFPTQLRAHEALYDIQFGHVRRPTHRNRKFDADRFEVSHHKWSALAETSRGVALLNDCKYGGHVHGGTLGLTLLKSARIPDPAADQGTHEFSYAFLVWSGDFASQGPVKEGYDFNVPALLVPRARPKQSLLQVHSPSVVVETVKTAEDQTGDVVIRLYEASGSAVRTRLDWNGAAHEAWTTDLLERPLSTPVKNATGIDLAFRAFEIKTVRIRRHP